MVSIETLYTPKRKPGVKQVSRKKDALEKPRFEKIHQHLRGSRCEADKRVWKQILLQLI